MKYNFFRYLMVLFFTNFGIPTSAQDVGGDIVLPGAQRTPLLKSIDLDPETYYDRVLGALVGSAIGDAMGASTEMMDRADIRFEYGYITGLTPVTMPKQAEGPWGNLLDAGATTDDTRWKYFTSEYLLAHSPNLNADNFAQMIVDFYRAEIAKLSDGQLVSSTDLFDEKVQRIDWIKEWARVALARGKSPGDFLLAQSRFYGGEMSCAGMLYSPMFGLVSANADSAYKSGFEHALFDIGYAKDITGMVAAMTNLALQEKDIGAVLTKAVLIDPYGYSDSRLIGRVLQTIVDNARNTVHSAREITAREFPSVSDPPSGYPYDKEHWLQQDYIYHRLEDSQKSVAFHAGEIFEILYTALMFADGDFSKTMTFIVNYGRDNDTVGAVAGMVLGALHGYERLPGAIKADVIRVNRDLLGIDLEAIARDVVSVREESAE